MSDILLQSEIDGLLRQLLMVQAECVEQRKRAEKAEAERDTLRANIEAIKTIIDSGASHKFSKTAIRAALEAVR